MESRREDRRRPGRHPGGPETGGAIDVLATDHAPHTVSEKANGYWKAPSGGPLVQHALVALYEGVAQGWLNLTDIPRLTAHRVAELFDIPDRGYLRPGYAADFVLVDPNAPWTVTESGILSKCGWSPLPETASPRALPAPGSMESKCGTASASLNLPKASHAGRRLEFAR